MPFLQAALGRSPTFGGYKNPNQGVFFLFLESKVAGLECGKLKEGFIIAIRRAGEHCIHPADF